jgi:hypothetical protein
MMTQLGKLAIVEMEVVPGHFSLRSHSVLAMAAGNSGLLLGSLASDSHVVQDLTQPLVLLVKVHVIFPHSRKYKTASEKKSNYVMNQR